MSLRQTAIKSIFWTSLQRFGSQGITFVVSVVLARILEPEDFGLIGMIGVFLAVGRSLADAGLTQSLIRSTNITTLDYSTVFYFNIVGSIIAYIACYLGAPMIADFYGQPILEELVRWYTLVFIINAIAAIQSTILVRELDFRRQFIVEIPSLILSSIVGLTMAYKGYGVWSLVVSQIVGAAANAAQLWWYSPWRPVLGFSKTSFKEHFSYGYKMTLSGVINTVYNNVYAIIIGRYFSPAVLGFYTRANSLKQLPVNNIGAIVNKVTFPLFAKIQNDDVRLKANYKKITQMVVFVVSPVLLISSALGEPLFRFLLTEKWLPAVPFYQILAIVGILYPINSYNLNVLKVKGRSDLFLRLEIIKKVVGLSVIIFSLQFGIYGLLWGSAILSVTAFFINSYYTGKFIDYSAWEQIQDILPIIFFALLAAGGVYFLDHLQLQHRLSSDIFRLLIGTVLGVCSYLLLIKLFYNQPLVELLKILKKQ